MTDDYEVYNGIDQDYPEAVIPKKAPGALPLKVGANYSGELAIVHHRRAGTGTLVISPSIPKDMLAGFNWP